MALFSRKKTDETPNIAPELENYYQAENRRRTWLAWVLGFATLAVTVLVALGLFFGGRYAYQKITKKSPNPTNTSQTENTENAVDDESSSNTPADSSSTQSTNTSPSTNTNNATPTPTTNQTNTNLPNTGPSDIIAVFVAVSMLAYILHRKFA